MKPKNSGEAIVGGCIGVVAFVLLASLIATAGWNYGVTEFVAAAGGHLGHVNILDTFLALLFVRALVPNHSKDSD